MNASSLYKDGPAAEYRPLKFGALPSHDLPRRVARTNFCQTDLNFRRYYASESSTSPMGAQALLAQQHCKHSFKFSVEICLVAGQSLKLFWPHCLAERLISNELRPFQFGPPLNNLIFLMLQELQKAASASAWYWAEVSKEANSAFLRFTDFGPTISQMLTGEFSDSIQQYAQVRRWLAPACSTIQNTLRAKNAGGQTWLRESCFPLRLRS